MKRHFYLFLSLLAIALPARGQVIFSEDFEHIQQNNFISPWAVQAAGGFPWQAGAYYIIGSVCFPAIGNNSNVAGVSDFYSFQGMSCNMDHNDSNVLLMTPYINLSGTTNAFLSYDSWFAHKTINGVSERATVEISTDSGAHWTVLADAPVATGSKMITAHISLAAYSNLQAVRLGFRYRDSGEHMVGWMIDNLKVYVPADHDLALTEATPADSMLCYVKPGTALTLGGTVVNVGAQPVTSFIVSYREGGGPVVSQTVSGISLPAFGSYTFSLTSPYTVSAIGRYDLKMWVSATGDVHPANDTGHILLHGVPFLPDKQVVIEHGTGTWFPFAPQGYVLMKQIQASDFPAALIALHDQDPMFVDTAYTKYVEYMQNNYVPYFFFDRRSKVGPEVVVSIPPSPSPLVGVYNIFDGAAVMAQFDRMRQYFGFASLVLHLTLTGNILTLDVTVTPAVDLPGVHRLALVLTEDKVQGSQSGYAQSNAYSNNAFGPMGGYEALPHPVPAGSMSYDFVGRRAAPAPEGAAGSLPLNLYTNNPYTYNTLQTTIDPAWARKNLKAIVLLIRDADSSILNSATVGVPALGIHEQDQVASVAQVYPNPADQSVNLLLYLKSDATVTLTATDITGRVIWQSDRGHLAAGDYNIPFRTDQWANGIYLLEVQAGQRRQTLKVDVIH